MSRVLKRDRKELFCGTCGLTKPASQFYVSNLSICMECKKLKVLAYKNRTDYNLRYRISLQASK